MNNKKKNGRPRKRYRTAQQIIGEIDAYKSKLNILKYKALSLQECAKAHFKNGPTEKEKGVASIEASRKALAAAKRIEDKRLPYLKAKLVEFQTSQLPGVDNGDTSIPA